MTRDYKWGVVPSGVPLLLGAPPPHFVLLTVATLLHRTNKLFKNSNSEVSQKRTKFGQLIQQISRDIGSMLAGWTLTRR